MKSGEARLGALPKRASLDQTGRRGAPVGETGWCRYRPPAIRAVLRSVDKGSPPRFQGSTVGRTQSYTQTSMASSSAQGWKRYWAESRSHRYSLLFALPLLLLYELLEAVAPVRSGGGVVRNGADVLLTC